MLTLASKQYMLFLSTIIGLILYCVFIINCTLDPLWYLKGNVVTHQNYVFNERLSKMNRFLKNPHDYDCYIFGSSRTTLLDESRIKGHTCFNFSFSGGLVGEFNSFATYLKDRGYQPKLVIIGVDGFNFFTNDIKGTIPDYIAQKKSPPSIVQSYLSIDALKLSLRTLAGQSPLPRYYKKDFSIDILPDTQPYVPDINNHKYNAQKNNVFFEGNYKWYEKLANTFQDSEVVFYVPPISPWLIINKYKNNGTLDDYIHAIHSVSNIGPALYDFSLPSYITRDKSRTYDGSHYDVSTNNYIADAINAGEYNFGIKVNGLSYDTYHKLFLNAVSSSGI
ncbi:hypothetical protein TevJSym_ae00780 [endosymbiont of Tevnia jerichonana (vent Tica)]|uniref:DUF1574 domain-containing protein n=2 Tax=Gammaproteobacteria TaxID=1236 RepID=G2FDD5_9GAMM|nr:hypothetical protein TevJSym_ae00780 [endosymbiont of Tevnia jerichonana (vent Tica)]